MSKSSNEALRHGDASNEVVFERRFSIRICSSVSFAIPLRGPTLIHIRPLYLTGEIRMVELLP